VVDIITRVLDQVRIPGRGVPTVIPAALSMELHGGYYTIQLVSRADGQRRGPRPHLEGELRAAVEDWRDALVGMLCVAYPDLDPTERLLLTKRFDDLLVALGLPDRGSSHLPDDVVVTYRDTR